MMNAFNQWFEQRAPRERQLLSIAFALLVIAVIWWALVAPALQTYRASTAVHAKLDTELAQMQAMASEAKQVRARPVVSAAQAQAWLDASIKKLGKATLQIQGSRVQVNFVGASPESLAMWLAQARSTVQLLPLQANWKRNVGVANAASVLWDGSIVLELPAK